MDRVLQILRWSWYREWSKMMSFQHPTESFCAIVFRKGHPSGIVLPTSKSGRLIARLLPCPSRSGWALSSHERGFRGYESCRLPNLLFYPMPKQILPIQRLIWLVWDLFHDIYLSSRRRYCKSSARVPLKKWRPPAELLRNGHGGEWLYDGCRCCPKYRDEYLINTPSGLWCWPARRIKQACDSDIQELQEDWKYHPVGRLRLFSRKCYSRAGFVVLAHGILWARIRR